MNVPLLCRGTWEIGGRSGGDRGGEIGDSSRIRKTNRPTHHAENKDSEPMCPIVNVLAAFPDPNDRVQDAEILTKDP